MLRPRSGAGTDGSGAAIRPSFVAAESGAPMAEEGAGAAGERAALAAGEDTLPAPQSVRQHVARPATAACCCPPLTCIRRGACSLFLAVLQQVASVAVEHVNELLKVVLHLLARRADAEAGRHGGKACC